ncbi:hypothetical protein DVB69_15065 [Sporosarcina sp. BI001-red]|uniref:hypothetical protein n=1 Tax=Sporosarcina sp. BI001-red TaxID=2282866 RepID=UPI000E21E35D|nr:hypothetical protein [Sporosarcina sp. BI001-red]REB05586.1 hypothetical protein DVB69_15065 [Sporosarcina sp. BI001-red]
MKAIMGTFLVVLISIGFADLLQGFLLTWVYSTNSFHVQQLEIPGLIKYAITAVIVTLSLYSVKKIFVLLRKQVTSQ